MNLNDRVRFKCEFRKGAMSLADIPVTMSTQICEGDVVSEEVDGKVTVDVFNGFDLLTGRLITLPVDKLYTIFDKLAGNDNVEDMESVGVLDVEKLEKAAGYKISDKTNLTTSLSMDGKQYSMKYTKFVPILVKAVQELSAKNIALEARMKILEG